MNLRDYGTRYECDEGVLWMNPANAPLKKTLVITELDKLQPYDYKAEEMRNQSINNARASFVIIEAFLLDAEWKVSHLDNTVVRYCVQRHGLTIAERWELFCTIVDEKDWEFTDKAWTDTRLSDIREDSEPTEKKDDSIVLPTVTPSKSKRTPSAQNKTA